VVTVLKKLFILIISILITGGTSYSQELTADDIIQRFNDLMTQPTVTAVYSMTITTSTGNERTFEMESYSADRGEKNLIKYLSPTRVKGQTILMLNNADDIWTYFPRTNRVRKLATHAKKQKMEGSDFSYEDMGSGDTWIEDFDAVRLEDEEIDDVDCYKIELKKKPESESGYSRLIMWIDKSNFLAVQIDYYDEDDPGLHLKRLVLGDVKDIEGVPTATRMVMTDIQDNTDTVMEYSEINYGEEIPDEMFTERGMKK
jgi:outer membrane lipoprotein-sorting protein